LRIGAVVATLAAIIANAAAADTRTAIATQKRTSRGPVKCFMDLRLLVGG
jgi:hypothetical protein